jgi:hypothetical protein
MTEMGPETPIEEREALAAQYDLEFDLEQVPALIDEHGLVFAMLDAS